VTARRLGGDPPPASDAVVPVPVTPAAPVVADLGGDAVEASLEVRASGPAAAALAVQSTALVTAGPVRGLATARCGPPRTQVWLLGGGTGVGETATLLLANPDPEPAVVDVTVLSSEGPADERPGRGLTVPAGGRVAVPLDTVAPERSRLAVRVQAARGRVAAAVRHERSDGVVPRGVDYAAVAEAPSATVALPGLPSGPGGRAVWVTNPGEVDLEVAVEVTTSDGQYVPDGLDAVAVPAQSTVAVDLSAVLATTPAAVSVTSDGGPVLAVGVAEDAGQDDVRDLAYLGPSTALDEPVLLPDVVLGAADHVVVLSALRGDAVVELSVLPVAGAPVLPAPPRRVEVPGGRTVPVAVAELLPAGSTGRVAVRVAADRRAGPVHAAVLAVARPPEGPLLTGAALSSAPSTVDRPRVVRDPAVGAGSG
jgi:hypothetical protein